MVTSGARAGIERRVDPFHDEAATGNRQTGWRAADPGDRANATTPRCGS